MEAARHLAQSAIKEGGATVEGRLAFMSQRLLARTFQPDESKVVQASLNEMLGYYQAHPQDAKTLIAVGDSKPDPTLDVPTLAAWTMLANEMMNLDEVLNK